MSGIKARLMKPTGIEWMDVPFEIATAIWNFIKSEYKKKKAKVYRKDDM